MGPELPLFRTREVTSGQTWESPFYMRLCQKPSNINVGVILNFEAPYWPERAPMPDTLPEHQAPLIAQRDQLPGHPDPLQKRPDPRAHRSILREAESLYRYAYVPVLEARVRNIG